MPLALVITSGCPTHLTLILYTCHKEKLMKRAFTTLDEFLIDLPVHTEESKFLTGFLVISSLTLNVICGSMLKSFNTVHIGTLSTNTAYRNLFYCRLLVTNYVFKFGD